MTTTRRKFLLGMGGAGLGLAALAYGLRRRVLTRLDRWTRLASFGETPPLVPHADVERATIAVARGNTPEANLDAALAGVGGIDHFVGQGDIVIIKVAAQWWNQGMTNVAAAKRLIERVLARPGFVGEVIVFENTHFRLQDGSGLARAFTYPSVRNVDVPGWNKLGDLVAHFGGGAHPVSFVGLVDGGLSSLSNDEWHDAPHTHGVYGGDGRGPIAAGDSRDGYHWDFAQTFRLAKSRVAHAQTPLTWPRFTSPHSGLVIDLKDGVLRRVGTELVKTDKKLTWLQMVNVNEHSATGMTAACKSMMGVVDMSCGELGTDPRARDYQSVHYFGYPGASWRMAGPLAHFAKHVRTPDLYLAVAEWIASAPRDGEWDPELHDPRLEERSANRARTVVAGTDPVAIDWWCGKNLVHPLNGRHRDEVDLDNPDSKLSRFLRYYRQTWGQGVMHDDHITVVT